MTQLNRLIVSEFYPVDKYFIQFITNQNNKEDLHSNPNFQINWECKVLNTNVNTHRHIHTQMRIKTAMKRPEVLETVFEQVSYFLGQP